MQEALIADSTLLNSRQVCMYRSKEGYKWVARTLGGYEFGVLHVGFTCGTFGLGRPRAVQSAARHAFASAERQ